MSFTIHQTVYEGPLDALLSLIEERKLSISDISLAAVADEFLQYVANAPQYHVGQVTQFVWVASTLVLIKAKSLLPTIDVTTEEETDIAVLEERLRQLAMVRRAARAMESLWGSKPLFRRQSTLGKISVFSPGPTVTIGYLQESLQALVTSLKQQQNELADKELQEVAVLQTIRLEEVISKIQEVITRGGTGSYRSLVTGVTEKRSLIVTFLALLEMARQAKLSLVQPEVFSDITFADYQSSEFVGDEV